MTAPRTAAPASPLLGYGIAVIAATLFAWLGPLSRWAYDAGMEPLPFVAWRAAVGTVVLAAIVAAAARRGRALRRPSDVARREVAALGLAALMALSLNLSIFGAFDRVTVAIALIGFYTYPAMVAAVAIALGREPASRPVLLALGLALAGMVVVVAGSIDPAGGVRLDPLGVALALGAAVSQTVFVTISRDGYRSVPAEQATAVILAGTVAGCLVIGLVGGLAGELAAPIHDPSPLALVVVTGVAAAAIPSLPVPGRHPADRGHSGGDSHAPRAGDRRRPGGPPAGRGAPAGAARRRDGRAGGGARRAALRPPCGRRA